MDDPRIVPKDFAGTADMSARSVRRSIHKLVQEGMAKEQPVGNPNDTRNGVRDVILHPEVRLAFALWCKEADDVPPSPLHRSVGVWFMVDTLIGKLFVMWDAYRAETS